MVEAEQNNFSYLDYKLPSCRTYCGTLALHLPDADFTTQTCDRLVTWWQW